MPGKFLKSKRKAPASIFLVKLKDVKQTASLKYGLYSGCFPVMSCSNITVLLKKISEDNLISFHMFLFIDFSFNQSKAITIFKFLVTRIDRKAIRIHILYEFLPFLLVAFNYVFMKMFVALFSINIPLVTLFIAVL